MTKRIETKTTTTTAAAVAAVITESNMTQKQRTEAWMEVYIAATKLRHSLSVAVKNDCIARNLSVFTLADAKAFAALHSKSNGETDKKKAAKAAANALRALRQDLRSAGIKVETDKRGGANNKKGTNGKPATSTNKPKAEGTGLPQWSQAIALMRDKGVHGLHDAQQRVAFVAMLAEVESYFKAMTTAKK